MSLQLERRTAALILASILLAPAGVLAHATGENYVWLNVEEAGITGRFEMRLSDVANRFDVELPPDPAAARAVLASGAAPIQAYLKEHFAIASEGRLVPYEFTTVDLSETESALGGFAQFFYRTEPFDVPDELEIRNTVLLDTDRLHRSLLCIQYDRRIGKSYGEEFTALVFSASNSEQVLDLTNVRGLLRARDFVWQGILHIWIGIDHVLFLLALLLTAVLVLRPEEAPDGPPWAAWRPVSGFKAAFWKVVKIVTVFTVAHSITLSLAALGIVNLPGRFVESVIALSIVLIALNNVFPKPREGSWTIIFLFGLFHGLGFASVMGDLPFRMYQLVRVVIAFNIGVEIGQLAIVAVAFPVFYWLRTSRSYRPVFLVGGSIAVGIVAAYWFVARALGGA